MSYQSYEPLNSSERWKIFWGVVAALAVLAVITFGGWRLGWWFKAADVDMQNQVNHSSQANQDSIISRERDRIQGYDATSNPAQKKQIQSTFCAEYSSITNPPKDLSDAAARICK